MRLRPSFLTPLFDYRHVLLYQPLWDHPTDYVLDVTNSVTTELLGRLSLSVEHQYLRDSTPQPGVAADDQKFSVVLRMAF